MVNRFGDIKAEYVDSINRREDDGCPKSPEGARRFSLPIFTVVAIEIWKRNSEMHAPVYITVFEYSTGEMQKVRRRFDKCFY